MLMELPCRWNALTNCVIECSVRMLLHKYCKYCHIPLGTASIVSSWQTRALQQRAGHPNMAQYVKHMIVMIS
jgi:hypothetical protein